MRGITLHFRRSLALAVGYLLLQGVCLYFVRPYRVDVGTAWTLVPVLFAVYACFRRTILSPARMRLQWSLLSVGTLLWAIAFSLSSWTNIIANSPLAPASLADLIYFLYGVPILLAISLPTEGQRVPLFSWLDGLQVLMALCLTYVMLFSVFPFMHQTPQPISAYLMVKTYDVENFVLAGLVSLRLLVSDRDAERSRFYRILAAYLWAYALGTACYNHMSLLLLGETRVWDLAGDVAFVALAVLAFLPPAQEVEADYVSAGSQFTTFMDNACPILYTSALLALGLVVTRAHFVLGVVSIVMALATYGLRSIVQQNELIRAKDELRVARDQLEVISLCDGLTGIANRRCFDRTLDVEWDRAVRLGHPLSLLMVDIDFFKDFNDQFGHRSGDRCLTEVAGALRAALIRGNDLLARYGGEEFAAILVDVDREGAERVASRMQAQVEALQIRTETPLGYVSISIGVATWGAGEDGTAEGLVEASDRALYQAKRLGRNRVEYWPLCEVAG